MGPDRSSTRATCAVGLATGLAAGVAGLLAAVSPADAQEEAPEGSRGAVELILDSSGSMSADDATGQTRIEGAREALTTLIGELPEGAPVGLRVYGDAQSRAEKKASCEKTRLVQPIEPVDPEGLTARLDDFEPGGSTPIGLALKDAARDLPDDGPQVLVLVSDGIDTCAPPDPCQVARDLARQGVDLRVQAIGLNVDAKARKELKCIAAATGGVYRDAKDADSLAESLIAATLRALRGYATAGEPIVGGPTPEEAAPIEEGQFLDSIRPREELWYSVEVPQGTGVVSSATLVPPIPRIPIETDAYGNQFEMELFGPAIDGESIGQDPGSDVDSDSQIELTRPFGKGAPVTLTTATDAPASEPGTHVFSVSLPAGVSNGVPLPNRDYPLELLVDRVGEPVEEEEPVEEPEAPEADEEPADGDDDGVDAPLTLGVGVAGALAGFALAVAAVRRMRS